MLMLSPYWAHRNENVFPDAESFIPVSFRTNSLFLYLNGQLDVDSGHRYVDIQSATPPFNQSSIQSIQTMHQFDSDSNVRCIK